MRQNKNKVLAGLDDETTFLNELLIRCQYWKSRADELRSKGLSSEKAEDYAGTYRAILLNKFAVDLRLNNKTVLQANTL